MLHIIGDPGLELAMEVARPANEPHRRHAEAMGLHGGLCRFDQGWMIGEPQIIVGAEIKHLVTDTIADDLDMSVLRRNDGALRLPKRLSADGFELGRNIGKHGHRVLLGQTMFHNGKRKLALIFNANGPPLLQIRQCRYAHPFRHGRA